MNVKTSWLGLAVGFVASGLGAFAGDSPQPPLKVPVLVLGQPALRGDRYRNEVTVVRWLGYDVTKVERIAFFPQFPEHRRSLLW
jgi:hypothetical protein